METSEPPAESPLLEVEDAGGPPVPTPPVVAVLVTWGAGTGLEATLASLREQDYPAVSVLVVDAGADEDPTERVATSYPGAFVRRAEGAFAFAEGANDAITTVEGAPYLLFCRRGVELEPDALRLLVEEAYRSNAGIVGPKVVDLDRPEVLLEVGMAIDHYGVPYTGIEPGEIDQEQHDAVKDVFYVSSTTMLVRADLFAALGGFDPETFPGVFDLDLCWRARLAGARVLVVPDARARHRRTVHGAEVTRAHGANARQVARFRVRVLLKSYSGLALVWVLPLAFVLNVGEAVAMVVTRRPRQALDVLGAWPWNLRRIRSTWAARRRVQAARQVPDVDVRRLMIRGSARLRAFLEIQWHATEGLQSVTDRTRSAAAGARRRLLRPEVITALVLVAFVAVGSRDLIAVRVPEIGTLLSWPAASDLWSAVVAPWREAGLGSPAVAPPATVLMAALTTVLGGGGGIARTVVVVGALVVGPFGAYRLARPLAASAAPAAAALVLYAVNPLPRNAVSQGRLGPLVAYALAPFLVAAIARGAADAPASSAGTDRWSRARPFVAPVGLTALVAAFWPPGLLLPAGVALALGLAWLVVGGPRTAQRGALVAAVVTAGVVLLLGPWILGLRGAGAATLGLGVGPAFGLADLARFATGPAGGGVAPWGILVVAVVPLVLARGARLAWAARAWMMVLVGLAAAWVPGRLAPDSPRPDAEGLLVLAAVGVTLAGALGVAVVVEDLRRSLFGWRQAVAVAAGAGLALGTLGFVADTRHGDWDLPGRDWRDALGWMDQESEEASFRVLWVGNGAVLPAHPRVDAGVGWWLSRDGLGDARELWPSDPPDSADLVGEAVALVAAGRTARLGHLVAPMGVRYVALVERPGPESSRTVPADQRFADALGKQLDLALVQEDDGIRLYENRGWAPRFSLLPSEASPALPAGPDLDPTAAALRTDLDGAASLGRPPGPDTLIGPGAVLLAESASDRWRARADGAPLERVDAFGWANGWEVEEPATVTVRYEAPAQRGVRLAVLVGPWLAWVALWWWTRRVGRGDAGRVPAVAAGPEAS